MIVATTEEAPGGRRQPVVFRDTRRVLEHECEWPVGCRVQMAAMHAEGEHRWR